MLKIRRNLPIALVFCFCVLVVRVQAQGPNAIRSQSSMKTENGLQRLLFAFPEGRLVVNLPDDVSTGDTISGTVSAEPVGVDAAEKSQNQGVLEGYVIDLGDGNKVNADQPRFTWAPIAPAPDTPGKYILRMIQVFDSKKQRIAAINIPIYTTPPPAIAGFTFPSLGQTGRGIFIFGPFDGNSANTGCSIGGVTCNILAESPRKIIVNTPTTVVGPTTITAGDGKQSASADFRNLKVDLSAPKTSLIKGESTTLTIQVSGLQGITTPVPVQVVTTGSVNTSGGNTQTINILPGQIKADGNFKVNRDITGTQAGGFSVTATVVAPPD